jgi:secondary thiamine-phosphate synthase enzyme
VKLHQETVRVATRGKGLSDITQKVAHFVSMSGVRTGLCTLFVRHTSCSLVIQENADPSVQRDLERWLDRIAPEDAKAYEHDTEGPDDMPAHLKSAVTRTSEAIPIADGVLVLGKWQAIYLWEHRIGGHRREIVVHVMGE